MRATVEAVLRRHSRLLARLVWVALTAIVLAVFVSQIPEEWSSLATVCRGAAACANRGGLDASAAHTLIRHGISLPVFASLIVMFSTTVLAIWVLLGGLIVWLKPDDRGALVAAYFLAVFPLLLDSQIPLAVTFTALILFGLLFPDGHFQPGWARWLAAAALVGAAASPFAGAPAGIASLVLLLAAIPLQIYRFRKVSTWEQRQQTKWAVFGLTATVLGFIVLLPIFKFGAGSLGGVLLQNLGFITVITIMPVSMALSVLRNRLWDIDRIISRALGYALLSAVTVGAYVGGVVGFQSLFGLFAHDGSPVAIALSTLAIVALFGPLRRRIQQIVDRRFYRSRYDASRTLATFGERLRDQVDLGQLSSGLTAVVHEALHPEHVSLWLREMREG